MSDYKKVGEVHVYKKQQKPSSSGCFIATAVYGSYDSPQVTILRNFRDKIMLPSKLGAKLVDMYYSFSPRVADFLKSRQMLCKLVRYLFVQPIVTVSSFFLRRKD